MALAQWQFTFLIYRFLRPSIVSCDSLFDAFMHLFVPIQYTFIQYNHDKLICAQNLLNRGTLSPLQVEIFSIILQTKCPYPGPEKRHKAQCLTGDYWILN